MIGFIRVTQIVPIADDKGRVHRQTSAPVERGSAWIRADLIEAVCEIDELQGARTTICMRDRPPLYVAENISAVMLALDDVLDLDSWGGK